MSKLWLRLDNAALIFPAVRRKGWSNVFRLSATLTEEIDPLPLQQAVNALKPRFPSMYVRLRTGLFWYYLEEAAAPAVRQDYAYPLAYMGQKELRTCCLRVLYCALCIKPALYRASVPGCVCLLFLPFLRQ